MLAVESSILAGQTQVGTRKRRRGKKRMTFKVRHDLGSISDILQVKVLRRAKTRIVELPFLDRDVVRVNASPARWFETSAHQTDAREEFGEGFVRANLAIGR